MADSGLFFASNLEAHGDRLAIIGDDGLRLTYAELAARADAFAAQLGEERRLIAIEAGNRIEPLTAYLGALRGGHPVILISPDSAVHQDLLARFRPDFLFAGGRLDDQRQAPRPFHPDLAILLSTSGTTGSAKLVRLSRQAIQANAVSISEYLALTADERPITSLPMHYSYGMSVVNSHLDCGAALLLTEGSVIEPAFWDFAKAAGATSLAGVPHTYELLERIRFRDRTDLGIRCLTQAGGRLDRDLVTTYATWAQARGARFYVMYGQTEAAPRMAYLPPDRVLSAPDAIGVPVPGGRFELVSDAGEPVSAPGQVGELVYHGPNVMLGYAEAPEDLARGRDVDRLVTGDLARCDADGLYRIVGRKSRFAKLFGLRINLDDIEKSLAAQGRRAATVSDDKVIGVALVAPADPDAVADALAETYQLPRSAFQTWVVDNLPALPSGKTDYRALTARIAATPAASGVPADAADAIARAFVHAFHRDPAPNDSFVSLGGDSLNYVVMSLELEEQLGFLPAGWEEKTLAELQAMVPRKETGSRFFKPVDSEIVLRAAAITAVVTNHVSDLVVGGGAEVLILLAGYNLARYQRQRYFAGRGHEALLSFIGRVIAPYYVALVAYMAIKRHFDVASLLLVSNYFGRFHSMIEPFWFLEALLQCFIIFTGLMAIPWMRGAARKDPWRFGLGLLVAASAAKVVGAAVFSYPHLLGRTPDAVFYTLAFGWCMQQANTNGRRVFLTVIALGLSLLQFASLPLWDPISHPANISHAVWLSVASLLILWLPRIPIPKVLHRPVTTVAAAAFYIYLSHVVPVELVYWRMHITNLFVNLAAALSFGIGVWWVVQRIELRAPQWLRPAAVGAGE
jgi:acyl-CoA synthetase (AMP-forming)/AMP-acid ligase II